MRVHDMSAPRFRPALCIEMLSCRSGNSGSDVGIIASLAPAIG